MKNRIKILLLTIAIITLTCVVAFFVIFNRKDVSNNYDLIINSTKEVIQNEIIENTYFIEEWEINTIGIIEIPSINLKLSVADGIDDETLSKYIGHFPSTPFIFGNVGIAGHNYQEFFADLDKVKDGDEIIYIFPEGKRIYIVNKIIQITETDWSYLDFTEDNRLTMITCVKGKPELRLCVQAIEKI